MLKNNVSLSVVSSGLDFDPNQFSGTDIERLNQAVLAASANGGMLRIPRRKPDSVSDRTFWLIDAAILVPGEMTLIFENCKVKLSDQCRDNFIRSANCGIGISEVLPLQNIHIAGVGKVVFEGADHPRASGDSGKVIGQRTYGTDAGKAGESQNGDWRNHGILLANVSGFQIENIMVKDSHCWGITLEYCTNGTIRNIRFESTGKRLIDGQLVTILNQDGLDLRRGCRNIVIDGIVGYSGDDLVALTGIKPKMPSPSGTLTTSGVCNFPEPERQDICNIVIRNVQGYCAGGHNIVRFLNSQGVKLHHILLDGLMDSSPEELRCAAALKIGDTNYGGLAAVGETYAIIVKNIYSRAQRPINLVGSLSDSLIDGVLNLNPESEPCVIANPEIVRNVDFLSMKTISSQQ